MKSNKEQTNEEFAVSYDIKRIMNDLFEISDRVERLNELCKRHEFEATSKKLVYASNYLACVKYDLIDALNVVGN